MPAADHTLVPMDAFGGEPFELDLVYADARHPENIFGIAAYHPCARLSLRADMARVVLYAAIKLHQAHGWTLILKDGLRTIEAQAKLIDTEIVRANPHWLEEPRLLSRPGQGAHPRGAAIDVSLNDRDGAPVDMGTAFDEMTPRSARLYDGFSLAILRNRAALEQAFIKAGEACGVPILPLPSEWWDFRIPASRSADYTAWRDGDLPGPLRQCAAPDADDVWEADMALLAKSIRETL